MHPRHETCRVGTTNQATHQGEETTGIEFTDAEWENLCAELWNAQPDLPEEEKFHEFTEEDWMNLLDEISQN